MRTLQSLPVEVLFDPSRTRVGIKQVYDWKVHVSHDSTFALLVLLSLCFKHHLFSFNFETAPNKPGCFSMTCSPPFTVYLLSDRRRLWRSLQFALQGGQLRLYRLSSAA
jgi:hypothetical protein